MNIYGGNADNQISGTVNLEGEINVSGTGTFENLTVNDVLTAGTIIAVEEINVSDNIILMGKDNPADVLNTGILEEHTDGVKKWSGLMRYHTDKTQYLIEGVTPEPTTTTDLSAVTRGDLVVKDLACEDIQLRQAFLKNDSSTNKWIIENDQATDNLSLKDALGAEVATIDQTGSIASTGLDITNPGDATIICCSSAGGNSTYSTGDLTTTEIGKINIDSNTLSSLILNSNTASKILINTGSNIGKLWRIDRDSAEEKITFRHDPTTTDLRPLTIHPESINVSSLKVGDVDSPDYTLPVGQGAANQAIVDLAGDGVLTWQTVAAFDQTLNTTDDPTFQSLTLDSPTLSILQVDASGAVPAAVGVGSADFSSANAFISMKSLNDSTVTLNGHLKSNIVFGNDVDSTWSVEKLVSQDYLEFKKVTGENPLKIDISGITTPQITVGTEWSLDNSEVGVINTNLNDDIRLRTDINLNQNFVHSDTLGNRNVFYKTRGTSTLKTDVLNGDNILQTEAYTYAGSYQNVSEICTIATENQTSNITSGVKMVFLTRDSGDTANSEKLRLDASGVTLNDAYTMPLTDGTDDQILRTDGSGAVSWEVGVDNRTQSTGILSGGIISTNGDPTKFNVSAGNGRIVDAITGVITRVSWGSLVAQSTTYVGLVTYIYINSGGTVSYKVTRSDSDLRDDIFLGAITHGDQINIDGYENEQMVISNTANSISDLANAVGHINTSGNIVSSTGNLTWQKSAGTMYAFGSGWISNVKSPSDVALAALDTSVSDNFQYIMQDGSVGLITQTDIIPGKWDIGTPYPGDDVKEGKDDSWTVQRVFIYPDNSVKVMMGQAEYKNEDEARSGISTEIFNVEPSVKENGMLIAYILVSANATDLTDDAEACIIQASKFGGTGSGGNSSTSIIGPNSATDTAIVIYDGITGKVAKNSDVLVDDRGEVQGSASVYTNGCYLGGLIYSVISSTTVINTVTQTEVMGYGSFDASHWKIGDRIAVELSGTFSNTASPVFNIFWNFCDELLTTSITLQNTHGAVPFKYRADVIFRTIGGSAIAFFNGELFIKGSSTTNNEITFATNQVNCDSSVSNTLSVDVQWGTAHASNSVVVTSGSIRVN